MPQAPTQISTRPTHPGEEAACNRILVVEDEMIVAKDIRARLQGMGYEVIGMAATGRKAVALARTQEPDLVLMDVMLKGEIAGTQAAELIQEAMDVPVVFLTAYSDQETLDRAKTTAYGYVLKPFDERDLETAIEIALYKHRTERELERQRSISTRADRLRSLGQMAAGIAHELSQPLVAVRGLAEHILIGLDRGWDLSDETAKDRLRRIVEQSDRMTHIIDHVRTFAREAENSDRSATQVNDVVRAAFEMTEAQFKAHAVELSSELAQGLPPVLANPYSLEEALLNVIRNAMEAVEERQARGATGETMWVRVSTHLAGDESAPQVAVEISDNGVGIPAEVGDRVFDPFYTTKGPDKGTGLGLSATKGILEELGGSIQVQSSQEEGATFTVLLPAEGQGRP